MSIEAKNKLKSDDRGTKAREKLIYAGLELFGELGFVGASTRDIALKAKQNIAAISYYFKNKEGLYRAVLEECLRQQCVEDKATLDRIAAMQAHPKTAPEEYLTVIKGWMHAKVLELAISDKRRKSFIKLMFREQFSPTKIFKEFYRETTFFKHDPFTLSIAAYLEQSPDSSEMALLAHSLAGPYIGFLVAPEFVRIKAGWKTFGSREAQQISEILIAQLEISLRHLRKGIP